MELEGFATGFNNPPRELGFNIENADFRISFKGVLCDDAKNIVSHGFEVLYDWSEVMNLILAATANYEDFSDIEESAEDALRQWMTTFQGWGLLSSLLPTERHRHFILALAYTSANWDESTGGPPSPEKIFDTVKFVYDNIRGKELRTLVPSLGVWFEEVSVDPEISFKGELNERKKQMVVFFRAKWTLEVKFLIEKKRVNSSLVDLAAETVTKMIVHEEQVRQLEVPRTLVPVLEVKYRDAAWVRSYWDFMEEVDKVEVDSKAATVEDVDELLEDIDKLLDYDGSKDADSVFIEDEPDTLVRDYNIENNIENATTVIEDKVKIVYNDDASNFDSSPVTHWWVLYCLLFLFTYLCS